MPSFVRRSKARAFRFCSQIWDVALAGQTHTRTDRQTNRKVPPPAKTYRVARALFSRGRLISEASLPVFHGGGEGFVTTKRKRKCESATRKTLNMAVGALLLRGRLGPFVRRVSVCCPIMVSSLLALLSLLVTHALYSRVELPPCQVPQTGPRYLGDLKAAVCNELYILCCDRVRGVMRVRAFLLASCVCVLSL